MTENIEKKKSGFVGGAFLGALFGSILGILFAPASGKETRGKIKEGAKDVAEKGKDVYEAAKDKIEPIVKEASEKSTQKKYLGKIFVFKLCNYH